MRLYLATAPASEPLIALDLRDHLRIDIDDEETLIETYITAARMLLEERLSIAMLTQTWDLFLDEWPSGNVIYLPRPPLQTVSYVKYYNTSNVATTLAAAAYHVDSYSKPARIALNDGYDWPTTTLRAINGVQVGFVAGYGATGTAVPAPLLQAMKLIIGDLFENREQSVFAQGMHVTSLPFGVDALVRSYNMRSDLVLRQK